MTDEIVPHQNPVTLTSSGDEVLLSMDTMLDGDKVVAIPMIYVPRLIEKLQSSYDAWKQGHVN